ncbi:hypothetical protein V6N13_080272 [Hibiscus sabdariffa]
MDGFFIKVFLANKQYDEKDRQKETRRDETMVHKKPYSMKLTDGRSYKEALANVDKSRAGILGKTQQANEEFANKDNFTVDPFHFTMPQKEMEWLENCLVGVVKDARFAQENFY